LACATCHLYCHCGELPSTSTSVLTLSGLRTPTGFRRLKKKIVQTSDVGDVKLTVASSFYIQLSCLVLLRCLTSSSLALTHWVGECCLLKIIGKWIKLRLQAFGRCRVNSHVV
jgi:hypothetical protein